MKTPPIPTRKPLYAREIETPLEEKLYGPWRFLPGVPDSEIRTLVTGGEGEVVPHMYLDNKGNVTIGIGHLLPTRESAQALPFEWNIYGPSHPPGVEEIGSGYDKIKAAPYGDKINANAFEPVRGKIGSKLMNIVISDQHAHDIFNHDLTVSARELKRKFPDLYDYPVPAQKALLDLHFNVGGKNFNERDWSMLFDAVRKKDWESAARESRRRDVQIRRNETVKNLFRDALE